MVMTPNDRSLKPEEQLEETFEPVAKSQIAMELAMKAMDQPHGRLRSLSLFDLAGASQIALIYPKPLNGI